MMQVPKTTQLGHSHDVCPNCEAELCGGKVPAKYLLHQPSCDGTLPCIHIKPETGFLYHKPAELVHAFDQGCYCLPYGEGTLCFSQTIGIQTPGYDGVSVWLFPCCGVRMNRFTGEPLVGAG